MDGGLDLSVFQIYVTFSALKIRQLALKCNAKLKSSK